MRAVDLVFAGVLASGQVLADCEFSGGNYYCLQADAIRYENIGFSGSYKDVTFMDETTCECTQADYGFSGNLSPLDEEVTVHFRGPLHLQEFAVYYPDAGPQKRDELVHQHKREAAVEWVHVYETVVVDADGQPIGAPVVKATPAAAAAAAEAAGSAPLSPSASPLAAAAVVAENKGHSSDPSGFWTPAKAEGASTDFGGGLSVGEGAPGGLRGDGDASAGILTNWKRVAHYTPGKTENCTFFNHQGGVAGSGTWSKCFGNSISYAGSDGISGASSPVALGDVTLRSNQELMIFSGEPCSDKSLGDCGYCRSGIPAHHGFAGATKMFVFEFTMPSDVHSDVYNSDMSALWLLNSKVPRTLQYGKESCSCWKTGCGEMDLFEVLTPGAEKMVSHIHNGQGVGGQGNNGGGGTQDYFARPLTKPMKAVVIFDGEGQNIHIVEITENLGSVITSDQIMSWMAKPFSLAVLPSKR